MLKEKDVENMVRDCIKAIRLTRLSIPRYAAAAHSCAAEETAKLDAMENPYGCSPGSKALAACYFYNRYPDPDNAKCVGPYPGTSTSIQIHRSGRQR